jgi:hypothetical protein
MLQVAYTLQGSALLQRRDAVRDTLEQQLRSAILESVLRGDGVDVTASYVGCQVLRCVRAAGVQSPACLLVLCSDASQGACQAPPTSV